MLHVETKSSRIAPDTREELLTAGNEAGSSAVSWAAVAAGAFATAALALILLALGAGAGLSSLSPWSTSEITPSAVGMGALLWLAATELISSGVGGYLAGRLRTKWVNVHVHEVYFRDTAHGFLSWAVALVMTAAFLTSAATMMVGGAVRNSDAPRADNVQSAGNQYFMDRLFRSTQGSAPVAGANDSAVRLEAGMIFAHALRDRKLAADDQGYLADAVASRTGLNRADAEKRVTDIFAQDMDTVDAARKAVAHSLYWLFVALLLGAFTASWAATIGGRERDRMHAF